MRTKNLLPSYVDSINNITRLVVVDVNKIKDLIDKILFWDVEEEANSSGKIRQQINASWPVLVYYSP